MDGWLLVSGSVTHPNMGSWENHRLKKCGMHGILVIVPSRVATFCRLLIRKSLAIGLET